MVKEYKGEIYHWNYENIKGPKVRVRGIQYPAKSSPMKSDQNCLIHTSEIVDVVLIGEDELRVIETLNSRYLLVGKPEK